MTTSPCSTMRTTTQLGRVDELGRAVDGLLIGLFAGQVEGAEDGPRDVVSQAGQDLLVIILTEAVQVGVNRLDVLRHALCVPLASNLWYLRGHALRRMTARR